MFVVIETQASFFTTLSIFSPFLGLPPVELTLPSRNENQHANDITVLRLDGDAEPVVVPRVYLSVDVYPDIGRHEDLTFVVILHDGANRNLWGLFLVIVIFRGPLLSLLPPLPRLRLRHQRYDLVKPLLLGVDYEVHLAKPIQKSGAPPQPCRGP